MVMVMRSVVVMVVMVRPVVPVRMEMPVAPVEVPVAVTVAVRATLAVAVSVVADLLAAAVEHAPTVVVATLVGTTLLRIARLRRRSRGHPRQCQHSDGGDC